MSTSMHRLPSIVLLAAALGLALSGCAGASDFPAYDREQTADDELPAGFDVELDEFDPASTRSAGSHEGVDYFLIKAAGGVDMGAPCLVMVAEDLSGAIGCGGDGRASLRSGATEAAMAPAGEPAGDPTGWTRISENVAVRDAR